MSRLLPTSVLGNASLERLYTQNAALRNQMGIELPASFAPLVSFIKDYIKANDFADSERTNGITHQSLAVQIVRASFCFGNDPFMIASKMRQETSFKRSLISSGMLEDEFVLFRNELLKQRNGLLYGTLATFQHYHCLRVGEAAGSYVRI